MQSPPPTVTSGPVAQISSPSPIVSSPPTAPAPGFVCSAGQNPSPGFGTCDDLSPDRCFTCAEQQSFGKCGQSFITSGGFCKKTCGYGACAPGSTGAGPSGVGAVSSPGPSFSGSPPTTSPSISPITTAPTVSSPRPPVISPAPRPPTPPAVVCKTVAEVATGAGMFTILLQAAQAAGLVPLLSQRTAVLTVFAPTDTAFQEFFAIYHIQAADLLRQPAVLKELLSYHVVPGVAALSTSLSSGQVLPTAFDSATLTVAILPHDPSIYIVPSSLHPAMVIQPFDVRACAAVVHTVDKVLIPKELITNLLPAATTSQIAPRPGFNMPLGGTGTGMGTGSGVTVIQGASGTGLGSGLGGLYGGL